MKVSDCCKFYFSAFQNVCNFKKNDAKTNTLSALSIITYITAIIPLGVAALYGAALLFGRVSKKGYLSTLDGLINNLFQKICCKNTNSKPSIKIQTYTESHIYTPLTFEQKLDSGLEANFIDDKTLDISFKKFPDLNFTIRRQNIFKSGAQVIVNAANSHLGGGGGIDGAIHKKGGENYKRAHRALKELYNSNYVLGHAAMIESGSLKKDFQIDNVIVVAGPQGKSNAKKENQLYSCVSNILFLAQSQGKISVAIPSISTGIFQFCKNKAAAISLKAVHDFMSKYPETKLKTISIHFLPNDSKSDLEFYEKAITTIQKNNAKLSSSELAETIIAASIEDKHVKAICSEGFLNDPIAHLVCEMIKRGVGRSEINDGARAFVMGQIPGFIESVSSPDYLRSFAVRYFESNAESAEIMRIFERSLVNAAFQRDLSFAVSKFNEAEDQNSFYHAENVLRIPLTIFSQSEKLKEYFFPKNADME